MTTSKRCAGWCTAEGGDLWTCGCPYCEKERQTLYTPALVDRYAPAGHPG